MNAVFDYDKAITARKNRIKKEQSIDYYDTVIAAENKRKDNWNKLNEFNRMIEHALIMLVKIFFNGKIIKIQGKNDDGGTDGIIEIEINGILKHIPLEARGKGFPNHEGEAYHFYKGWETKCLITGIYLNESTIRNHEKEGFIYVVEIKDYPPRFAIITPNRIKELLAQPYAEEKSTNSGIPQSIKYIPLEWFEEFKSKNETHLKLLEEFA